MAQAGCLLLEMAQGWQIAGAGGAAPAWQTLSNSAALGPEELAAAVERFVAAQRLPRDQVAIGLHSASAWCVGFTANATDLRQRRLLEYQLEDALPLAAEQFVADFLVDGAHVLGIAAEVARLEPLVSALERRGLRVQSIAPAALLAAGPALAATNGGAARLVILQEDDGVSVFRVGRQVQDWRYLPAEGAALARHVTVEALQAAGRLPARLVNVPPEFAAPLSGIDQVSCEAESGAPFAELVRQGAAAVLGGRQTPLIELRRGALSAGDPYRAVRAAGGWLLAAAALLLIGLTTFFALRAAQLEQAADTVAQRQAALYRQAFPGTTPPTAIVSRLESERAKLAGQRSDEAKIWLPPSGMNVLHSLVAALPDGIRFQVETLRIENGQIDLGLEVPSVGEAGQVATALARQGFVVEPPSTEQRAPQRVSVRLRGAAPGSDKSRGDTP